MKGLVVFLVAIIMLIQPLWPVVEYITNYDYIANVLCENKDEPKLKCNGKCYLAQLLAEDSQGSEKNPFNEEQNKTEVHHPVFFQSFVSIDFTCDIALVDYKAIVSYQNLVSSLFSIDTTHPPELA